MPVEKKNAKLRHWLVLLYSEHHSILLFLTKTSESRFVASEVFPFRLFFYSPYRPENRHNCFFSNNYHYYSVITS